MRYKNNTLVINLSDSKCGNCGKSCNPEAKTHDINYGYDMEVNGTKGCGCRYEYVTSDYTGMEDRVKEMRPDLKFYQ